MATKPPPLSTKPKPGTPPPPTAPKPGTAKPKADK